VQTQGQHRNELELQYDGPIPKHLTAWNESGAFPRCDPPNSNDIAFFVARMQAHLEDVTAAAGFKRGESAFFIVAVSLEFGINGPVSGWELSMHSPIFVAINDSKLTVIAFTGALDAVWEGGRVAWASNFDRDKMRELQAKLGGGE
jgi:hypothetical protein